VLDGIFNLDTDNVFLVTDIDGSTPRVKSLGTHDLTFAPDDNPALVLLKRDAEVLACLAGEPVKETAQGKMISMKPTGRIVIAGGTGFLWPQSGWPPCRRRL